MDLTPAPGFKRRPAASSSPHGVTEIVKSPPPFSPSSFPSSPSSDPSSPMSTSSSPSATVTGYHNKVKGHAQGAGVARVSSTSASRAAPSLSTPPPNTSSSDASFHLMSTQPGVDSQREGGEKEIYDPFHPTEGERDGKAEEEEGEKYDPFDPTGSPASDAEEGSGKVRGLKRKAEAERRDDEEKEEAPPDSTLPILPTHPPAIQLPLRRRLDRDSARTREKRENADSDNSEIEEGEIVGTVDRDGGRKRAAGGILPLPTGASFGAKPERILRVLDGDDFVSVRAEGNWEMDVEPEESVGVGDLRRKLVSRRKERYISCPASSSLSPQPQPPPSLPPSSPPPSSLLLPVEQGTKSHKSSKSSKDRDRRKHKDGKAGEKEERRRKRRKEKEDTSQDTSKDGERGRKAGNEVKGRRTSSRSNSRKRKRRRHSSREASQSQNSSGRGIQSRRSFSSLSEEHHRERERERDKVRDRDRDRDRDWDRDRVREKDRDRDGDRDRDRDGDRDRDRDGDRDRDRDGDRDRDRDGDRDRDRDGDRDRDRDGDRDRDKDRSNSRRRDDRDRHSSRRKKEREREGRQHSSRERGSSKRSKRSRERREDDRERQHDREHERRRDGRPVVPPSIQDLNGSDLFAIKRTITVTTTTTTTTVPGSPTLAPACPRTPTLDSDKPHKRKKKRKQRSVEEAEDGGSCRSRSQSLSPPRYHSYESDRYSDKLEIDMLSLDGEALDSDYPSLEDTPPVSQPPEPPARKTKATPKTGRHHPKKKSHTLKKTVQSESSSSSSIQPKSKGLSLLSSTQATSASAPISSGQPSTKRARKLGKDKEREKGSRKESGRSGKSKKESGGSRKGKLQSKVSVLVREGVSSTTGASVSSGKLGMELLGPGVVGGGGGGPVVGGSIAVVFRRDNESRSPFLKPCSEPLSLGGRNKDLGNMGKRSSLAAPLTSLAGPAALKSKKAKPSSTTSTSSSASSPSSSLATKRRRRLGKKAREKGGAGGLTDGDGSQSNATSEGWGGASSEIQSGVGSGSKTLSPHTGQAGPAQCSSSSSSSSSTSALPPSSSPPHTPPPSMAPSRDIRESSPDSQTVDSSCKTPEPSFLVEDCPTQTSPTLPPSSPVSLSTSQGTGLTIAMSAPIVKPLPPDDAPKSLASPPCSSSSSGCGPASLSLPLSSSDPSSSSSSVSSSSASKPPPPPPPPPAAPSLPWSLQTGVDCTAGGVLALTALLFKMEEANIASRAKAQEFIQATSQILSQANQSQSQQHAPSASSSSSSQIPPPPSLPPGPSPTQFILHGSLPLVGCTKTPPSHLHPSMGGGCAQTPPPPVGLSGVTGSTGETGWDSESKDPDKYLKKLHTQERAVEEVKLAIKPYYQRKDINKDEYKDILRKAVHKICHSRTGEINPVKVSNLVKLYVQRYKYFRKHGRKMDEEEREERELGALHSLVGWSSAP